MEKSKKNNEIDQETADVPLQSQKMYKVLKVAVVIMGIAIVMGFAFLASEVMDRSSQRKNTSYAGLSELDLQHQDILKYMGLPRGSKIQKVYLDAGRSFVLVDLPKRKSEQAEMSANRLYILDSKSGRVIAIYDTGHKPGDKSNSLPAIEEELPSTDVAPDPNAAPAQKSSKNNSFEIQKMDDKSAIQSSSLVNPENAASLASQASGETKSSKKKVKAAKEGSKASKNAASDEPKAKRKYTKKKKDESMAAAQ